jgi:hypothetical protein
MIEDAYNYAKRCLSISSREDEQKRTGDNYTFEELMALMDKLKLDVREFTAQELLVFSRQERDRINAHLTDYGRKAEEKRLELWGKYA